MKAMKSSLILVGLLALAACDSGQRAGMSGYDSQQSGVSRNGNDLPRQQPGVAASPTGSMDSGTNQAPGTVESDGSTPSSGSNESSTSGSGTGSGG